MSETVLQKVTFDYFRPIVTRLNEEKNERKFEKYFDVGDWLGKLLSDDEVKKNLPLGGYMVYLDEIYHYDDNENCYVFRIFRLRDSNLPSLIKEGDSARPITLGDNENIGEEMNILYDQDYNLLMVQRNRMSVGTVRLAEWMSKSLEDEQCQVELRPLFRNLSKSFFGTKRVKKLSFTVETLGNKQYEGKNLKTIINGLMNFGQRRATITLSVGRERNRFLEQGSAISSIEEILDEGGRWFSSAFVDVCSIDDEKGRTEKVDLFEDLLHDTITFEIPKKKPLNFRQARVKIHKAYTTRKLEIIDLLH